MEEGSAEGPEWSQMWHRRSLDRSIPVGPPAGDSHTFSWHIKSTRRTPFLKTQMRVNVQYVLFQLDGDTAYPERLFLQETVKCGSLTDVENLIPDAIQMVLLVGFLSFL